MQCKYYYCTRIANYASEQARIRAFKIQSAYYKISTRQAFYKVAVIFLAVSESKTRLFENLNFGIDFKSGNSFKQARLARRVKAKVTQYLTKT